MSHEALLERLLEERGVDLDSRESFLNPDYDKLHDPFLLPDMRRASERVRLAIKHGEHIVIFSDYDADGIPGAVVMNDFFKRIGYKNFSFYIPHRHDEGYGLNLEAIREVAERGAKLIITVDCGTNDLAEIALAKSLGIETVVTDHHEAKSELPEAFAIVNPKRRDSEYPFKEICGSAVAYKLVQAIYREESFGVKPGMEKWSLDMVGIATLSDMVPLVDENRIFAKFGLEVLKKSPRPGLEALFKKISLEQKYLNEDDITFMLTPRINAASRMGSPEDAFKLLSAESLGEAERWANHLESINAERKGLVASMVKEAKSHLSRRGSLREAIVVGNPEWKPALVGLVANSLVEEYCRPAFVWGRDGDGRIKGSCRSYNGYNLFSLMELVGEEFEEFGGHAGAGGFSLSFERLPFLEERLASALASLEMSEKKSVSSVEISAEDVDEKLWQAVSLLAPFGLGNEKPIFKLRRAKVGAVRSFGKEKNHLELEINGREKKLKAVSFFSTPESFSATPQVGVETNVLAHLEKSYFKNRPELRLRIVDIISK